MKGEGDHKPLTVFHSIGNLQLMLHQRHLLFKRAYLGLQKIPPHVILVIPLPGI